MLYMLYVHQDYFQVYREEDRLFTKGISVSTSGLQDTVQKITEVVRGLLEGGAKAVVIRGYIKKAMLIRNRDCCPKCTLLFLRCIVGVLFFYAKECIRLHNTGTLLQTLDGRTKYRRRTSTLMELGREEFSYDDISSSLKRELEEGISDQRRDEITEALMPQGPLEVLCVLNRALEDVREAYPTCTIVADDETYPGGFSSEIRYRLGRQDLRPEYTAI